MRTARLGTWLLAAAALVGFVVAVYDDFGPYNGINGTQGAHLVVISTLLMLIAAALVLFARGLRHWVRAVFDVLIFLDIVGTGFAAYMLEADLLLVVMVVSLVGWLIRVFASPRRTASLSPAPRGLA